MCQAPVRDSFYTMGNNDKKFTLGPAQTWCYVPSCSRTTLREAGHYCQWRHSQCCWNIHLCCWYAFQTSEHWRGSESQHSQGLRCFWYITYKSLGDILNHKAKRIPGHSQITFHMQVLEQTVNLQTCLCKLKRMSRYSSTHLCRHAKYRTWERTGPMGWTCQVAQRSIIAETSVVLKFHTEYPNYIQYTLYYNLDGILFLLIVYKKST